MKGRKGTQSSGRTCEDESNGLDWYKQGSQVKECGQPLEAEKDKEMILPWSSQEKHNPADPLISDFQPPES